MIISEPTPIWNLKAEHHNGQVFLTWKESDNGTAVTYNVYMHNKPINSENIHVAKKIGSFIEKHSARDWWEDLVLYLWLSIIPKNLLQ